MRDLRRASKQGRHEDARQVEALRRQIMAGAEAIEHGDFTRVDDADLDAFLAGLGRPTHEHP